MPALVSDAVDAYVIRRLNARLQFLLLQRRADDPLGHSWQAIHTRVAPGETALSAAERAIAESTGLSAETTFSADYVNQVFDHLRDAIVLVPVLVMEVATNAEIALGTDFSDYEWCERDDAAARLPWAGQRWSVRHIDDILAGGGTAAEFYRVR